MKEDLLRTFASWMMGHPYPTFTHLEKAIADALIEEGYAKKSDTGVMGVVNSTPATTISAKATIKKGKK